MQGNGLSCAQTYRPAGGRCEAALVTNAARVVTGAATLGRLPVAYPGLGGGRFRSDRACCSPAVTASCALVKSFLWALSDAIDRAPAVRRSWTTKAYWSRGQEIEVMDRVERRL